MSPELFQKGGTITKQKLLTIGCAMLVFLSAFGLVLHPLVIYWYNEQHQSEIHTQYFEAIEQVDNSTLIEAWELANEYNTALASSMQLSEASRHDALLWASEDYEYQLNIAGNSIMGYVEIPRISVELPIYHGTDPATLAKGCGHLLGTSLPIGGASTHCVLSSQSSMSPKNLSSDLDKLEIGDIFHLVVLGETLAYQVNQIKTVLPYDTTYLGIEPGQDHCTLVTPLSGNTHNLLIRGIRIPNEKVELVTGEKFQEDTIPFPQNKKSRVSSEWAADN